MQKVKAGVVEALVVGNHLGESVSWNGNEGSLYWVNCEQPPELLRWHIHSGKLDRWPMPERIGGFAHCNDGGMVVVLASGIYRFDRASEELTRLIASPLGDEFALHEVGVDRCGYLWLGSINQQITAENLSPGGGKLFRVEQGTLVEYDNNISCSNGLAFSPDGRRVYHADTSVGQVHCWSIDDNGAVGERQLFLSVPLTEGMVDGAAVDSEGGYWATMFIVGSIRRYTADGKLDREYTLPFTAPTKVAFGGSNLDTLYITTAQLDVPGLISAEPLGNIYSFKPGFTGIADSLLDSSTLPK